MPIRYEIPTLEAQAVPDLGNAITGTGHLQTLKGYELSWPEAKARAEAWWEHENERQWQREVAWRRFRAQRRARMMAGRVGAKLPQ